MSEDLRKKYADKYHPLRYGVVIASRLIKRRWQHMWVVYDHVGEKDIGVYATQERAQERLSRFRKELVELQVEELLLG